MTTVIEEARKMAWSHRYQGAYGEDNQDAWMSGIYDKSDIVQAFIAAIELGERRAEAAVVGWLPIESAPKDGTDFVTLIPRRGKWRVVECYWERGMTTPRLIWQGWSTDKDAAPTYWMPLPPPPAIELGKRRGRIGDSDLKDFGR